MGSTTKDCNDAACKTMREQIGYGQGCPTLNESALILFSRSDAPEPA